MSLICSNSITGIAQSGGSCYGSCNNLSSLETTRLCYSQCVTGTLGGNCQLYVPEICPDCPACPSAPECPAVDTLYSCNRESFYDDFNATLTDPNMYFFLMSVFVGLLAIKAIIKTIKSAIR